MAITAKAVTGVTGVNTIMGGLDLHDHHLQRMDYGDRITINPETLKYKEGYLCMLHNTKFNLLMNFLYDKNYHADDPCKYFTSSGVRIISVGSCHRHNYYSRVFAEHKNKIYERRDKEWHSTD